MWMHIDTTYNEDWTHQLFQYCKLQFNDILYGNQQEDIRGPLLYCLLIACLHYLSMLYQLMSPAMSARCLELPHLS